MSVLGLEDLYNEIGKNIFIYPLKIDNIKANTINLTVSKYAWSVKSKKNICKDHKKILIEANDTALIYTEEAIYVSKKNWWDISLKGIFGIQWVRTYWNYFGS
jgi:hypothetical protein